MAEYHYKYTTSNSGDNKRNNNDDLGFWIAIIAAFIFFWPAGIFLLVCKLLQGSKSGSTGQQRRSGVRYTYRPGGQVQQPAQQPMESQVRVRQANYDPATMTASPVRPVKPNQKVTAGRGLIISGSIVGGVFGLPLIMELAEFLADLLTGHFSSYMLSSIAALGCLTAVGLAMLYAGLSKRRKARRFKKYLGLIGKRQEVSISAIAKATGRNHKKVCDDLQDMLDNGMLPVGYLDLSADQLVLSDQGIADEEEEEAEEEIPEPKEDDAILAEIRAVNDSIPDPVMTAKIRRIEEITGKILEYQRKYPEKAGQLRSFLNYYLPTTLKILRAYAQLDQQGVEGQNISSAKARIEGMMDKVVEGFEKQLDKLFQNAALDITSDVAVLEKMLDNDGLSSGGMTLGT